MIRRPPRSTQSRSSAASDVYKRQGQPVLLLHAREDEVVPSQQVYCLVVLDRSLQALVLVLEVELDRSIGGDLLDFLPFEGRPAVIAYHLPGRDHWVRLAGRPVREVPCLVPDVE